MVCGVPPIGNLQDRAMTELMSNEKGEVIYDRSHEHLGTAGRDGDRRARQLLKAVKTLRDNGVAAAQRRQPALNRIRHATVILPQGADWVTSTESIRSSEGGVPVAWEMKPLRQPELEPAPEAGA